MAVQRLKNYSAASRLQQYCLALGAASSPPSLLFCRSPGMLHREHRRREPSTDVTHVTSLERLSAEGEWHDSSHRARHGSTYLVNPSRYPPSQRFRVPQARSSHNTSTSKTRPCVSNHSTILQEHRDLPHWQASPIQSHASLLSWIYLFSPPTLTPPTSSPTQHQILLMLDPTVLGDKVPSLDTVCTSSPSLSPSPTSHPPPPHDKPTPSQLAFVLLKLREELPAIFGGHHTMELYANNMTFENSLGPKPWTVQGVAAYSVVLTMWRVMVKAFFSQTQLELLKITKDPDSGKIEARWRACGKPRAPWYTKERIILEAFSTFSVNSDGNIITHKMDKVMPGGKEQNRMMSWLAWVGMALVPSPQHSVEVTKMPHNDIIHV